jgi:hypothetical protein
MCGVAGYHRQTVNRRGRCDKRVALRVRIRHVEARTTLHDGDVDRQDTTFEAGENLSVYTCSEDGSLGGIFSCESKRPNLDFQNGNYGEEETSEGN